MPDPTPLKTGDLVAPKTRGPLMTIAGVLAPLPETAGPETMVACSTTDRTGAPLLLLVPLGTLQAMAPSGRTVADEALHQEAMEKAKQEAEAKKQTNISK